MTPTKEELAEEYGDRKGASILGKIQRRDDFLAGFQKCHDLMAEENQRLKLVL